MLKSLMDSSLSKREKVSSKALYSTWECPLQINIALFLTTFPFHLNYFWISTLFKSHFCFRSQDKFSSLVLLNSIQFFIHRNNPTLIFNFFYKFFRFYFDNKERLTCLEMLANFLLVCVPAFLSPRIKSFEWLFHKSWWGLCILNSISISSSFFLFFFFFIALYSFYLLYDPLRPCFIYLEIYAFNTFL